MSNRELKMNIMKFVIVIAVKNFLIYLKVPWIQEELITKNQDNAYYAYAEVMYW